MKIFEKNLGQPGCSSDDCSTGSCCDHHESEPSVHSTCDSGCGCAHEFDSQTVRPLLIRTFIAGICVCIAMITEAGFIAIPEIGTAAAIIALLLTAYPILKEAVTGLLGGERNVCELASIAIVAAVAIGEFTAAAEVAIILTIGELAEDYTYSRSKRDIEGIVTRNPRFGHIIRNEEVIEVPVQEIAIGDRVMVRSGDIVPVDGVVVEGRTFLDESCLTGESLPVLKEKESQVYSGSTNLDGTLIIRTTKVAGDSTYSKITELIRQAGQRRPPSHPFIDRFARVYSPLMIILAIIVFILTGSVIRAITVLIVACPCALLLATPSAVLATLGSAAKSGILIKGGEFLEVCRNITILVLDKTGTITSGNMAVSEIIACGSYSRDDVLLFAATAECSSSHPIAKAVVSAATDNGLAIACTGYAQQVAGLGIEDIQQDHKILVGNRRFMENKGIDTSLILSKARDDMSGTSEILVACDTFLIGILYVSDTIRPESSQVFAKIRQLGINKIEMLTGDNQVVAEQIAQQCGIEPASVHSGMYPGDKENYVSELQKRGEVVCFVGDGTNDGPALARSDLGISIGSREDTIALETSSVILMQRGLGALPEFIELGRRTSSIIIMNICIALGLNLLLIIAAGYGLISPATGAIGHQVATLVVLVNSTRLAYNPGLKLGNPDKGVNVRDNPSVTSV